MQQNERNIQQFSHSFKYNKQIDEQLTIKDLLMNMCNKKKAFVYELDWEKDFVKII